MINYKYIYSESRNFEMKVEQIRLFQVPYTGLEIGRTYQLTSYFKKYGTDKHIWQTTNVFQPGTTTGVFTVAIPEETFILRNDRIVVDSYLYRLDDANQWKQIRSTTQMLKADDAVIAKSDETMIGDGLISNAITFCNEEQKLRKAELQELKDSETYIKETEEAYDAENMAIRQIKEKLNKAIEEKNELLDRALQVQNEMDNLKSKIQLTQGELYDKNDFKRELEMQLDDLTRDVESSKRIIAQRSPKIYNEVDNQTVTDLMTIKHFPKEIQGYDWQIESENKILTKGPHPLVYALVGKHEGEMLLKIGSTVDFVHRQAVYDYHEDDGYFDKGSMVVVSHLMLSNVSDPRVLELFTRYVFEQKHEADKQFGNKWFKCDLATMNDLKKVFDYIDTHLQRESELDTFIKELAQIEPEKRYSKAEKKAKEVAAYVFR